YNQEKKMSLNTTKATALIAWVNSLHVAEPIVKLTQLQDCTIFIKIIGKVNRNESIGSDVLEASLQEKLQFLSNFLQFKCRYNPASGGLVSWQNILQGENLEIELSKVTVLLLYLSTISYCQLKECEGLEYNTQTELASILRFVLDNENELCLSNLEQFLQKQGVFSSTSSIISEEGSPVFRRKPIVRFLDLHRIASNSSMNNYLPSPSPSSPIRDVLQTPQFQMRRLRKQLADERALRDELDQELAENRRLLAEKDTQILEMQQRIGRLVILSEKQANQVELKELEELQNKNESLSAKLHSTLKQCQDLKTSQTQMQRKIDTLTEENGELSLKERDFASRLKQSEKDLKELTEEYREILRDWESKEAQLNAEVNASLSAKKCLEEKIQILEGKISVLEDQLEKAREASPVKGEVMGDILQLEALKHEVAELAIKVNELQSVIKQLEEEKASLQTELDTERAKFAAEHSQATNLIASLQASISEINSQKRSLEQAARAQEEQLTAQIATLHSEISKLNAFLVQKDHELVNLQHKAEEEKKHKTQLTEDLQTQELSARKTIQDLKFQVEELDTALKHKDDSLSQFKQELEAERENEARQIAALKDARETAVGERDSISLQYAEFKKENERLFCALNQKIQTLEETRVAEQAATTELRNEKDELITKVQELNDAILELSSNKKQDLAHLQVVEIMKRELQESEEKLKQYEQKLVDLNVVNQENMGLKEQLSAMEQQIRKLQGTLDVEKRRFLETHEETNKKIAHMEEEIKKQVELKDKALLDFKREADNWAQLEGQLKQLAEENLHKFQKLQCELSSAVSAIKEKEEEREKLCGEIALWKQQYEAVHSSEDKKCSQMEAVICKLKEDHEVVSGQLQAKCKKLAEVEAEMKQHTISHQEKTSALQNDLSSVLAQMKEKESEELRLQAEVASMKEKFEMVQCEKANQVSAAETKSRKLGEELSQVSKEFSEMQTAKAELELKIKQLNDDQREKIVALELELSKTLKAANEKEATIDKLTSEAGVLQAKIEETEQHNTQELVLKEEQIESLIDEKDQISAELAAEKESKSQVEIQLQQSLCEHQKREAALQTELSSALEVIQKKEENLTRQEELHNQQEIIHKLQAEVSAVEDLKTIIANKEKEIEESHRKLESGDQEKIAFQSLHQEKLQEAECLQSKVVQLEQRCTEQEENNRTSDLEQQLQASRSVQAQQQSAIEALKIEASEKSDVIEHKQQSLAATENELSAVRSLLNEKEKFEETLKKQVSDYLKEIESHKSKVNASEQELSSLQLQCRERKEENESLKCNISAEVEKCQQLQTLIETLQAELASASTQVEQKDGVVQTLENQIQSFRGEAEKHEMVLKELHEELTSEKKTKEDLHTEMKSWEEKYRHKEMEIADLHKQLTDTQSLTGELMPLKQQCQQQQNDLRLAETKHKEELEKMQKLVSNLQSELEKVQSELAENIPLKELCSAQEGAIERLEKENCSYRDQVCKLQQTNSLLVGQNLESSQGQKKFEDELAKVKETHAEALQCVHSDFKQQLTALTKKCDAAERSVLEEREKFQEERQKLNTRVLFKEIFCIEQLETVEECAKKKKLNEHNSKIQDELVLKMRGCLLKLQEEVQEQQKELSEVQAQLSQKEQAVEHYKGQMEKAKAHYDAKKSQNQELVVKLQSVEEKVESAHKENTGLRSEVDRLNRELQHSLLQSVEAEKSNKSLLAQVQSLEAQVEYADRQLRELGKFQLPSDALKRRGSTCIPQSVETPGNISGDSLNLSGEDLQPLSPTRKVLASPPFPFSYRKHVQENANQRLPPKVESLESLYFTPIHNRVQSKMDSSISSLGDLSLDSGRKTRSARRRTTQLMSSTMAKEQLVEEDESDNANASFFSVQSAKSQPDLLMQSLKSGRPRSMALVGSNNLDSSAVFKLPGYRPSTRSSTRRSLIGDGATASDAMSTFHLHSCQNEPDQLEDWNRIAELQQRNRICPPHLKTSYPLESRPSLGMPITDEDLKTGDPRETLRRATMIPSQIKKMQDSGVTTRRHKKRLSEEGHQGADTPESKKSMTCFPRPMTPKDKNDGKRQATLEANRKRDLASRTPKQADRRQSMAFSILNTPKKIGSSLLNRVTRKKVTPRKSPRLSASKLPQVQDASKKVKGRRSLRNVKI
uniref:Nuclear mitotic apparatus protein 1 n=1 Tax=Latimeria chalumnae TaxID=7897 RepID=H3AT13_LATCH